jgi:L-ascorbate metabolism protein UlaG (beta-lactamase superfamily)
MSVRIRWLGWAGVELEADGARVVVDPLEDASAAFAALGERAAGMRLPEVIAAEPGAVAGLVTHLHRDHADAGALRRALDDGACVHEPQGYGGTTIEQAAIAPTDQELTAAKLTRRPAPAWTSATVGPFTLTALPAVDGTGDPQVSWLIEAGGTRVLHLGDTMFHGWWWRIAERFGAPDVVLAPINGARLRLPHRRPASPVPAAMEPEQAALAADLLRADRLVPIHYDGYELAGIYEPVPDALERLNAANERVTVIPLGESIDVS